MCVLTAPKRSDVMKTMTAASELVKTGEVGAAGPGPARLAGPARPTGSPAACRLLRPARRPDGPAARAGWSLTRRVARSVRLPSCRVPAGQGSGRDAVDKRQGAGPRQPAARTWASPTRRVGVRRVTNSSALVGWTWSGIRAQGYACAVTFSTDERDRLVAFGASGGRIDD